MCNHCQPIHFNYFDLFQLYYFLDHMNDGDQCNWIIWKQLWLWWTCPYVYRHWIPTWKCNSFQYFFCIISWLSIIYLFDNFDKDIVTEQFESLGQKSRGLYKWILVLFVLRIVCSMIVDYNIFISICPIRCYCSCVKNFLKKWMAFGKAY